MSDPAPPDGPPSDSHDPSSLDSMRGRIDALDRRIVDLLNARARVVVDVGHLKRQDDAPIYAPDREKAVLDKVRRLNAGPLPDRCLEAVYRELMSGSFALERPLKIGYLGPPGTFSHAAAKKKFGSSVEYVPMADIPGVFEAVSRRHIDYGMVPVENSAHGGVVDTLDAFLAASAGSPRVCAEVLINVRHNLLSAGPWDRVTTVLSKPEVFAQCRHWLSTAAKDRDVQAVASTSAAAERASKEEGVAAIASLAAADLYGLRVVFENIEDDPENVTRFFVIAPETAKPTGDDKTAVLFTTANKPGALSDVLDVFKSAGINLTDIEKRPSRRVNWEYVFFIDLQGHADAPAVKQAIDDARQHCLQLNVLGGYPRATEVL